MPGFFGIGFIFLNFSHFGVIGVCIYVVDEIPLKASCLSRLENDPILPFPDQLPLDRDRDQWTDLTQAL